MSVFKPYRCQISAEHVAKQKQIDDGVARCKAAGAQVSSYWTTCGSGRNRYACRKSTVRYINNKDMGCCNGSETCLGSNCNPCTENSGCVASEAGEFPNQGECDKRCNASTYQGASSGWICNCCKLKSVGLDAADPKNYEKGTCTQIVEGVIPAVGNVYATEDECVKRCNAVSGAPSSGQMAGIVVGSLVGIVLLALIIWWIVAAVNGARRRRSLVSINMSPPLPSPPLLTPSPSTFGATTL